MSPTTNKPITPIRKMTTTTTATECRFYLSQDFYDEDDNGDEQVSIRQTWIDADTSYTYDQIIEEAEEDDDWKILFGEGSEDKVDDYVIECVLYVDNKLDDDTYKVITPN